MAGHYATEMDNSGDRTDEIPLPPESLESILKQIEAELLRSPVYQNVLDSLREMFGDAAYAAQMMVHSVSREAILIALKQLSDRKTPSRSTASKPLPSPRSLYLYRLGKYLRSERRKQGFSLAQIHHFTRIPIPHLHALEVGQIRDFPRSRSYLYGAIRLWGNALGLNGARLAAGIPPENSPVSALPKRRYAAPTKRPLPPPPPPQLTIDWMSAVDWRRYLAYGTPVVAAVGVVLWLAQLNAPQEGDSPSVDRSVSPPAANPTAKPSSSLERYPGEHTGDISPPEEIHRRRD
ncbi:MAG: helix-turn-helix domain-containing protein [Cyanobacteria bacterium SBC]|nr:helix-turn-helix domain-containing protein [Cyanobacteria bacterium SBC]